MYMYIYLHVHTSTKYNILQCILVVWRVFHVGGVILRRRGTRDMMGGASRLKTTLIVMWPINHFLQVHNVNSRMSNANSNVRIVYRWRILLLTPQHYMFNMFNCE